MPAPLFGQITTTGSAQQIDPNGKAGSCTAFVIKAPVANAGAVYVGDSTVTTSTGHIWDPGDTFAYERVSQNTEPMYQARPNDFWVWIPTGGDKVTWLAVP